MNTAVLSELRSLQKVMESLAMRCYEFERVLYKALCVTTELSTYRDLENAFVMLCSALAENIVLATEAFEQAAVQEPSLAALRSPDLGKWKVSGITLGKTMVLVSVIDKDAKEDERMQQIEASGDVEMQYRSCRWILLTMKTLLDKVMTA